MVSQLEPTASNNNNHHQTTVAPPRAASSVASRTPHSSRSHRSRRYNRSHLGIGNSASSYSPQNEFPIFNASGDVEIFIRAGGAENRYLLHRHTLTRCSGFFEVSTSEQWSRAKPVTTSRGLLVGGNELARLKERGKSGILDDAATEDPNAVSAPSTVSHGRRWRYELNHGADKNDIPMLVQRDESTPAPPHAASVPSLFGNPATKSLPPTRNHKHHHQSSSSTSSTRSSVAPSQSFFRSVANLSLHSHSSAKPPPLSQADEDLLRDYDNLFRIFYNYPPVLDGVNVADAYVQCKSLLNLADLYDALPVVGPRVDHHLLQFQSRLWKQIAKYPISYLRLGFLARSRIIFQEAIIHVVGQWPAGERSLRANLPEQVLDLIEDKVDELEEAVSRIEVRLFRLGLTNSRGERISPQISYLDWLAVSLFRQWLADSTCPAPPPSSSQSSSSHHHHHQNSSSRRAVMLPSEIPSLSNFGRTYRIMGSTSVSSYLTHDECKKFLKLTPELYSRENLRRFEKKMEEMKLAARDLVRPLLRSDLELDMGGTSRAAEGIGYLTCTTIAQRDLPWPEDG